MIESEQIDLEVIKRQYDEYHAKKYSAQPSLKIARCVSRARLRQLAGYLPDLISEIEILRKELIEAQQQKEQKK